MAADPQRAGLRLIIALRLTREQMAHGFLPAGFSFLETLYPAALPHNPVEECCATAPPTPKASIIKMIRGKSAADIEQRTTACIYRRATLKCAGAISTPV
jgi:hypothetical protein